MWKRKISIKEQYGTLEHFLKGDEPCHYIGQRYIEGTNFTLAASGAESRTLHLRFINGCAHGSKWRYSSCTIPCASQRLFGNTVGCRHILQLP